MANTHVVLEGVKDYTRELLGTKARDEAVDAADRAEAQAERAEAAADNAEAGIRDDTITKQHLTPGLRDELDGKADRTEVPTTAQDVGARPDTWTPTAEEVGARPDTWMPTASDVGARPADWVPTAEEVGARPGDWRPTSEDITDATSYITPEQAYKVVNVSAGGHIRVTTDPTSSHELTRKGYVDSRIQLVTSWPASPTAGVLYLMEEG